MGISVQGSFTRGHQWENGVLSTQDSAVRLLPIENWLLIKGVAVTHMGCVYTHAVCMSFAVCVVRD